MSSRPVRPARPLLAAVAVLALLASAGTARAGMITTTSVADSELPGLFNGSVTVDASTTSAVITIQLTNVSPVANGGYITAFAFNDPNGAGGIDFTGATLTSAPSAFKLVGSTSLTKADGLDGSPFGNFDLGVTNSTNASQPILGGGNPTTGIGVGQTGTFVFSVTGTGLDLLTAQVLLSTYATDDESALLVRFRGFNNGLSDKDVVGMTPPTPTPGAVPAPPGLVLAGVGFGCLLLGRRRKPAPRA